MKLNLFVLKIIILSIILPSVIYAEENVSLYRPTSANFYVLNQGNKSFLLHQNRLSRWNINKTIARLASAKRISTASDDSAGLAVAEKMNSLMKQLKGESMNAENMRNFHRYVESVLSQDYQLLKRIRLLIVRSSSGILTAEDRGYNQTEIDQFLRQINMNARFSKFNKIGIISELTIEKLKIDKVDVVRNLYGSIKLVDEAMKNIMRRRVIQGVKENVLTFKVKGITYNYINLMKSQSRISDMDIAEGMSNLIKNSMLIKSQYGLILKQGK